MYRLCNFKKLFSALILVLAWFASGGFTTVAKAGESVVLSWDSNPEPDIAGYRVRYGQTSGTLDEINDTGGPATELSISSLIPGETYYFAVLAYNQQGVEGPLSSEISYDVPLPAPARPGPPIEFPELAVESSSGGFLSTSQTIGSVHDTPVGGNSVIATITLRNRGKAKLSGLSLSLSGPGVQAFSTSALATTTLAAGESTTIAVNFAPTVSGQQLATLQISSNDRTHPQFDIALAGNGATAASIAVFRAWGNPIAPGAILAFGNLELGTTTGRLPLTIRNVGTATLSGLHATINGPGAADFTFSPVSVTTLAPGASTTIEVIFNPTAADTTSATLHLAGTDATDGGFQLTLTGTGMNAPHIVVEDTTGDDVPAYEPAVAPSVALGKTGAPLTYTIRNSGTAPLTGITVATTGADASSFTTTQPAEKSLQPGASTTFDVTFHPVEGGWSTANVRVSGAADVPAREFSLKANGMTFPAVQLTDENLARLTTTSRPVEFGTRNLVDKRKRRTITLKNAGNAPLTGLKFTCSGTAASDFKLVSPKSRSLAPGKSVRLKVYFSPSAVGARVASVRVASNAGGPPSEFAVSGTGIAAPEIEVRLGTNKLRNGKAYVDFGKGQIGKIGTTETIVITNVGSATLKQLKVSKNGVSPDEFSMSRVRGRTLAVGKSARFKVTFRARKSGIRWASIHISSNDADDKEFEVILTGTGTNAKVAVKNKGKKSGKSKAAPAAAPSSASALLAPVATAPRPANGIEVIAGRKYRTLTISRTLGVKVSANDIQVSSDRVEWASGTRHTTVLQDDAELLVVRDNTPVTQDHKRFIRLKR